MNSSALPSLKAAILARFQDTGPAPAGASMAVTDLVACLAGAVDTSLPLLARVRAGARERGMAEPGAEQVAILSWIDACHAHWESHFPLEEPLCRALRQLQPLLAAQALASSTYLNPGAHPLHRMLDLIQDAAVGWQARLGRAGEGIAQDIESAVSQALLWLTDQDTDLAQVCAQLAGKLERHATRATRMTQRLVEKEQGRVKTNHCRRRAARMINAYLAQDPLPPAIGEFLKGPWFDSAQLILLKYGEDSEQWQAMRTTTDTLLDSLRRDGPQGNSRRQYLFQLVSQLPRELKRWLLSLQHDTEAINEAMELVEYVHLRLLRDQDLEAVAIAPIADAETPVAASADASWETGGWYLVDRGGELMRLRLAMHIPEESGLVFANAAGMMALQLHCEEFTRLLAEGAAQALESGDSYTRSLAESAGLDPAQARALAQAARDLVQAEAPGPAAPATATNSVVTRLPLPDRVAINELDLAIGTWLGFHDGEAPMMARLAAHNPDADSFLFVNRAGVKLREISAGELLALIDAGQVDILEARSTFREQVAAVTLQEAAE